MDYLLTNQKPFRDKRRKRYRDKYVQKRKDKKFLKKNPHVIIDAESNMIDIPNSGVDSNELLIDVGKDNISAPPGSDKLHGEENSNQGKKSDSSFPLLIVLLILIFLFSNRNK